MPRPYLCLRTVLAVGLALAGVAAACGSDDTNAAPSTTTSAAATPVIDPGDGGDYQPQLDPADFVAVIDNPYLPLARGARWVYEGDSDGEPEEIEVVVTDQTREIEGITAIVVRDTHESGPPGTIELVEFTAGG